MNRVKTEMSDGPTEGRCECGYYGYLSDGKCPDCFEATQERYMSDDDRTPEQEWNDTVAYAEVNMQQPDAGYERGVIWADTKIKAQANEIESLEKELAALRTAAAEFATMNRDHRSWYYRNLRSVLDGEWVWTGYGANETRNARLFTTRY